MSVPTLPGPPTRVDRRRRLSVDVFTGGFVRRGRVGAPRSLEATVRHMALSTSTLVVDDDHPRSVDLVADGARCALGYDGGHLLSGPVVDVAWDRATRTYAVKVDDDFGVLYDALGWAVPTAGLDAQTAAYDVRTGPAETVVKQLVGANATRLGLPLTMAPDQGRGAVITVSMRFHLLADRLLAAADSAGIGITVRQVAGGLVLDCYEPALYPRVLTDRSGILVGGKVTRRRPTVTRVVAGSQGEAEARVFYSKVDRPREAQHQMVAERFIDVRDTADTAEIDLRMQEALDEGAARSGLAMELAESAGFAYGRTVRVGDRVRARLGPALKVEDVLREAKLQLTPAGALSVVPTLGERSDDPDAALGRALGALARGIRALRTT